MRPLNIHAMFKASTSEGWEGDDKIGWYECVSKQISGGYFGSARARRLRRHARRLCEDNAPELFSASLRGLAKALRHVQGNLRRCFGQTEFGAVQASAGAGSSGGAARNLRFSFRSRRGCPGLRPVHADGACERRA